MTPDVAQAIHDLWVSFIMLGACIVLLAVVLVISVWRGSVNND